MLLAFLTLTGVIAIVAVIGFFMLRKGPEIVQGQAEVTEYRVSSKVPGRILNSVSRKGKASVQETHWPYSKHPTCRPNWNRHVLPKLPHRHRTKRR